MIHDPQPAAPGAHFAGRGFRQVDLALPHRLLTVANPTIWEFFRPFVELHDAVGVDHARVRALVPLDMAHVLLLRQPTVLSTRCR